MKYLIYFICFVSFACKVMASLVWPTPSDAFAKDSPLEDFVQPTASGILESGLFGDVRSGGRQFHEALDIKPEKRDRKGEALDDILAAMDGRVAMVNTIAGNSSYGRYVVLVHEDLDVPVYTLYAHFAQIDKNIPIGSKVKAGQRLGQMGRSASYAIPKDRAHLHFEIGLLFSESFDGWYKAKKYKIANKFGNYNGMNLSGFDPLEFYKDAKAGKIQNGMAEYIKNMPTAFVIRVYTRKTPDFVKMYPALVDNNSDYECGWDVYFTWHGMPTKFEKIKNPRVGACEGEVEIYKYDKSLFRPRCRNYIQINSEKDIRMTSSLKVIIDKIFKY